MKIKRLNRSKNVLSIVSVIILILSNILIINFGNGISTESANLEPLQWIDPDNSTNNFAPEIEILSPGAPSYSIEMKNAGVDTTYFEVNVTDADNFTTEGATISTVKLDLSAFGAVPGWVEMVDDGSMPNDIPNDGNWTFGFTCPLYQPVGDYVIDINATDNGTMPGPLWTNTQEPALQNFTVSVVQFNRNMTINPLSSIIMYEDGPDRYLELNDTVFFDLDLSDPNIDDALTFKVWDGDSWEDGYSRDNFTVTIAAGEAGNVTFHPLPNKYTLAYGEPVTFKATDTAGHWQHITATVKITSTYDGPYWVEVPTNPIIVVEEIPANFTFQAADIDSQILYYTANIFYEGYFGSEIIKELDVVSIENNGEHYAILTLDLDDYEVYFDEYIGLYINLTVDDGNLYESAIIELDIIGINDETELHFAADFIPEIELDFEATEDEEYNLSFFGIDDDIVEDLTWDFEVVSFPTNAITSSYNIEDKINITGYSAWAGLIWDMYPAFQVYDELTTVSWGQFLFAPDNNDVGELELNFTVTDGVETKWMVTDIEIINTNDPPYFTKADGAVIHSGEVLDYTGPNNITVGEALTITVAADDEDLIHGTETLDFGTENASQLKGGAYIIRTYSNTKAEYIFNFTEMYKNTIQWIKITVTDGEEIDWLWLKIEVRERPLIMPPPPQPPPKPDISSPNTTGKYKVGEEIEFDIAIIDPTNNTFEYRWDFGDGTHSGWLAIHDLPVYHIYLVDDEYIITLTIKDLNGLTNSTLLRINITATNTTVPEEEDGDGKSEEDNLEITYIIIIPIVIIIITIIAMLFYFGIVKLPGAASKPQPELKKPPSAEQPQKAETDDQPFRCENCGAEMGEKYICVHCGWNKWKY